MWTYTLGSSDNGNSNYPYYNCPCAKYPGPDPPKFVGSHYYCESGKNGTQGYGLYTYDPLRDGSGCPSENSCCHDAGMPWFFRQFPATVTGDIEVRICYVEQIQLYVQ